jgi:hypothetical protein
MIAQEDFIIGEVVLDVLTKHNAICHGTVALL